MNYTKKIEDIFDKSGISSEDQKAWLKYFENIGEKERETYLSLVSENREFLPKITEILRKKSQAHEMKNFNEFDDILEEEKKLLSSLQ